MFVAGHRRMQIVINHHFSTALFSSQLFLVNSQNVNIQKAFHEAVGDWWPFKYLMFSCLSAAGPPQLMMAFTADNQLREDLVADRDSRHGKNTAELREARQKKLAVPSDAPSPAANHWQTGLGKAWQTSMERTDFKR